MSKPRRTKGSDSANNVPWQHHKLKLSAYDSEIFLALMKNPPEPNAALREAVANYKKLVKKRD